MISNNKSNKTFGVSVWAIQNSTIIYVLMAVFLILGVRAYVTMPRENFPEITETTIFISTPYPGNTAQDIERFVTDPIEEGIKAAKLCCINIIAAVKTGLNGDWGKLDSFIKLTGYVNSTDDFIDFYIQQDGLSLLSSVGAYKIEGFGAQLFSQISGDYFSILGLPILPLFEYLRKEGFLQT